MFDPIQRDYVQNDKDSVAVDAKNNHIVGKAQVMTNVQIVLVGVIQLLVQLGFLVMSARLVSSLDTEEGIDWVEWVAFGITVGGTVLQLWQKASDAVVTNRHLPELKRIAYGRHKTFDNTTAPVTDEQVKEFMSEFGTTQESGMHDAIGQPSVVREINLHQCNKITDEALATIAEGGPYINSLKLAGCSQVTDAGLAQLAQGCHLISLLNLGNCSQVTDDGLAMLAKGCDQLTNLALGNCAKVSDTTLETLAVGCKLMSSLNLWGCKYVTDAGLAKLAGGCRQLTMLILGGCDKITDAGLETLAKGCPQLNYLNLRHCIQITDTGLATLVDGCGDHQSSTPQANLSTPVKISRAY